jgi:hypothetical protein
MLNMTNMLDSHGNLLEAASFTASRLHYTLEKAAPLAEAWNETLNIVRSPNDWTLRLIMPTASVVLGNYGMSATLARNTLLMLGGKLFTSTACKISINTPFIGYIPAETIVQLRRLDWQWWGYSWLWISESPTARSFTQQAQTVPAAIVADFEAAASEPPVDMV